MLIFVSNLTKTEFKTRYKWCSLKHKWICTLLYLYVCKRIKLIWSICFLYNSIAQYNKNWIQRYYLLLSFLKFRQHYMFIVNKSLYCTSKSLWNELRDCIPNFECAQSTTSRCSTKITGCICTPFYHSDISTKMQILSTEEL